MSDRNPLLRDLTKDLFYYKIKAHENFHKKKNYKNLKNYPEP
jgi:hypothetical protein